LILAGLGGWLSFLGQLHCNLALTALQGVLDELVDMSAVEFHRLQGQRWCAGLNDFLRRWGSGVGFVCCNCTRRAYGDAFFFKL